MQEKYEGKIKVPFCVKYEPIKTSAILSEILGREVSTLGFWEYYGVNENGRYDICDDVESFGKNTTLYTLEELQTIIDEVNVEVGIDETVSNERLKLIGKYVITNRHPTEKALVNGLGWEPDTYEVYYPWTGEDEGELVRTEDIVKVFDDSDGVYPTTIKANISFDVNIKGQVFNLTEHEVRELYLQLCLVEGELQDWSIGQ